MTGLDSKMTVDDMIKQLEQLKAQYDCGHVQLVTEQGELVEICPRLKLFDSGYYHIDYVKLRL